MKALIPALLVATLATLAGPAEARRVCTGDCGGDGLVTVDEIVRGVDIALGTTASTQCGAFDADASGDVDVSELLAAVTHALTGCPLVTVADAAFWQTLLGEADRSDESLELFRQAIEIDAEDGRLEDGRSQFLMGMMHLYRYGRSITDFRDFSEFARNEVRRANDALDRAVELTPDNLGYPGFRGAATFQNGITNDDPELVALGIEQLRESMELWPLFNRFSFLGTVAAVVPAGDPMFAEAYEHLIDLLGPAGLSQCTPQLCGNGGRAPRNLEGSAVLFGDIFAKAGNGAQARNWYQLAVGTGTAGQWRFTALARDRLNSVVDRVALYQDEDPDNDPPLVGLAGESCTVCHAR